MKISHLTRFDGKIASTNGYGYATDRILNSLTNLGYEVSCNDHTADAGFWFEQPWHWRWAGDRYKIGYHPWESTLLMPDWPAMMNKCDEIWTPSPLIAKWYKEYNDVKPPIYVYEHGVDPIWETKPHTVTDKIRFLHIGGEAVRKGLPEILKAWRMGGFLDNPNYELLLKTKNMNGLNIGDRYSNVQMLDGPLPIEELVELHYERHIFIYPSWGEGFGLNPIQAMATGMPTISTYKWAPYARYMDPNLMVDSIRHKSPWAEHPGEMFKPDVDDLIDKMRYAVENYDTIHKFAQNAASAVKVNYSWDGLTRKVFRDLENRL